MLPAYIVYKAENIWSTWTEGGPKGTRYNCSRSGWFDSYCFSDWFETLFVPHAKKLRGKEVLIGDNLSSHFTATVLRLTEQHDILFVCLPPNATHLLQPLDMAFYRPVKGYWQKVLDEWKSGCKKAAQTLSKDIFPLLLTKLYTLLYPTDKQKSDNMKAGFITCGINPPNKMAVLAKSLHQSKIESQL